MPNTGEDHAQQVFPQLPPIPLQQHRPSPGPAGAFPRCQCCLSFCWGVSGKVVLIKACLSINIIYHLASNV